jgi:hypothetical protein
MRKGALRAAFYSQAAQAIQAGARGLADRIDCMAAGKLYAADVKFCRPAQ